MSYAEALIELCSNNIVEYNTLIIDLQLAKDIGAKYLKALGDSKLVVDQVKSVYEVCHQV